MKKYARPFFLVLILFTLCPQSVFAVLDQFMGDSAIYSGETKYQRPNVLLLVDNSHGMSQAGSQDPYNPSITYTGDPDPAKRYTANAVYERVAAVGGTINYSLFISNINNVTCDSAKMTLQTTGYYAGPLKKQDGSCNSPQPGNYFLGNLLNYINEPPPVHQISTWYTVGSKISVTGSDGKTYAYICQQSGWSAPGDPANLPDPLLPLPVWPIDDPATNTIVEPVAGTMVVDGGVIWTPSTSILDMVKDTLAQVLPSIRNSVNVGVMVFGSNNKGGEILFPIKKIADLSDDSDATPLEVMTEQQNYVNLGMAIGGITVETESQPVNEALFDASFYFKHDYTGAIGITDVGYNSPLEFFCQQNFVVVLTTGASPSTDPKLPGDLDAENFETKYMFDPSLLDPNDPRSNWIPLTQNDSGDVMDVAKYLYETDLASWLDENQSIQTHVIQLLTPEVPQLRYATDASHGRGSYYKVNNSSQLTEALVNTTANIVRDADTSFVAPVVPTSPENRTYSGERVYLGFFNPISQKPWAGNLKKYALDYQNRVMDVNGNVATNSDGSFSATAQSFWSEGIDAGMVDQGGVGEKLASRTTDRIIYTNLVPNVSGQYDLTDTANRFSLSNAGLTPATFLYNSPTLGLTAAQQATARAQLIDYILGFDSYDENGDGVYGTSATALGQRRDWIMGDILHSRPQIINYNTYEFDETNEADPNTNRTMIYVGSNDGMLHAFRDADGEEAWSFIPDEVLPNLKELGKRPATHTYFLDASPSVYIYDHDRDGNIGPTPEAGDATDPSGGDNGDKDKVILIFGLRRGGDAYYALDVTNPNSPVLLWKITPETSGFSQLGETWSEPTIEKMRVIEGGVEKKKVVAFIGGGYDREEDARYGGTYLFPNNLTPRKGEGEVMSDGDRFPTPSNNRPNAKGRAIYAFEIATLQSDGSPTIPTTPQLIWEYTWYHNNPGDVTVGSALANKDSRYLVNYSFPTNLTVVDTDYDGFADRIYAGDTGGRMWRFSIGSTEVANWGGDIIYGGKLINNTSVTAYSHHKIFYKPSVVFEPAGEVWLAFGTGDRAHPLNVPDGSNVKFQDRMVLLKDKWRPTDPIPQSTSFVSFTFGATQFTFFNPVQESNLVDVTLDELQYNDSSETAVNTRNSILANLNNTYRYGWFIRLDETQQDGDLAGEKVLANPLIFNKVAYYTTYKPNDANDALTDPCSPGNLGQSALYAVDYKTGEAVLNFDTSNDVDPDTFGNTRGVSENDKILQRSDRKTSLGIGIPSGLVVVMPPGGDAKLLIGCGGGLCAEDPKIGGTIIPIYWMTW